MQSLLSPDLPMPAAAGDHGRLLAVTLAEADGPGRGLRLPPDERRRADRFARGVLRPLLHDLVGAAAGDAGGWAAYRAVNRAVARDALRRAEPGDLVCGQGFELLSFAGELRRLGADGAHPGLLLDTPFPVCDLLVKLPGWRALLADLLEFEFIGVPCRRDLENLLGCVRELAPAARVSQPRLSARLRQPLAHVRIAAGGGSRTLAVGVSPFGVDTAEVERQAALPEVARRAGGLRGRKHGRALLLGVDALDPARGLLAKLRAYEAALERWPDLRRAVTLLQVVLPGRGEPLPAEAELKRELDRRVGEVNGRYGTAGWVPVRHLYRQPSRSELLAFYRAADVRLLTPLKDGLSLAALESCAADLDGRGTLVLSEFAGAAEALAPGALLVNPCDVEGTAAALRHAVGLGTEERELRAGVLRAAAARYGAGAALEAFLATERRRHAAVLPWHDAVPISGAKAFAPGSNQRWERRPSRGSGTGSQPGH